MLLCGWQQPICPCWTELGARIQKRMHVVVQWKIDQSEKLWLIAMMLCVWFLDVNKQVVAVPAMMQTTTWQTWRSTWFACYDDGSKCNFLRLLLFYVFVTGPWEFMDPPGYLISMFKYQHLLQVAHEYQCPVHLHSATSESNLSY